jgi:hypothetical protein
MRSDEFHPSDRHFETIKTGELKRGSVDVVAVWLRLRPFPWALSDIITSDNVFRMLRTAEEAELRYLRAARFPSWRLQVTLSEHGPAAHP